MTGIEIERERLVRLRGRARGPSGAEDRCVMRALDHPQVRSFVGPVHVRAWHPPWDGDTWVEVHRTADLEPAPVLPRSSDDLDLLPRGELVAIIERFASLPRLHTVLGASDMDLVAELPERWRRHGRIEDGELFAALKIAKKLVDVVEQEKRTNGLRVLEAGEQVDPVGALRELRAAQAAAYAERHAWVQELWIAKAVGRRPSTDARHLRAAARRRARIAQRAYERALSREE